MNRNEIPRLTEFMGYSGLTSGPNESPKWGHFLATYMDECQEVFESWLEEHDEEVRDSMRPLDSAPWICDRWRGQNFARSNTKSDDYNGWEPRLGYAQRKKAYGYDD